MFDVYPYPLRVNKTFKMIAWTKLFMSRGRTRRVELPSNIIDLVLASLYL